jgi:hypothetical protein
MSKKARKEYLEEIRKRYFQADRAGKKQILDEFCEVCGYNRKYAIRLIGKKTYETVIRKPAGRKKKYHQEAIVAFLEKLLIATNMACSRRLKAAIPGWVNYSPIALTERQRQLLLEISFSTIDRLLRKKRKKYGKLGLATTKPGSLLRKQIPIATNQWDERRPGFIEADTVAHCGGSTAGQYAFTVQIVDIATGWTACRGVWGKGERGVFGALQSIEKSLPFRIRGFDSDNGGEFLNYHLAKYFQGQKPQVQFTRSRPYEKNDNAHIEEKNWSHTRQYLGYQRFEYPEMIPLLNDLYTTEWDLLFNYFIPSMKLKEKNREGSRIKKLHDEARTPFERLCNSGVLSKKRCKEITSEIRVINPFEVQEKMKRKILAILKLALVEM